MWTTSRALECELSTTNVPTRARERADSRGRGQGPRTVSRWDWRIGGPGRGGRGRERKSDARAYAASTSGAVQSCRVAQCGRRRRRRRTDATRPNSGSGSVPRRDPHRDPGRARPTAGCSQPVSAAPTRTRTGIRGTRSRAVRRGAESRAARVRAPPRQGPLTHLGPHRPFRDQHAVRGPDGRAAPPARRAAERRRQARDDAAERVHRPDRRGRSDRDRPARDAALLDRLGLDRVRPPRQRVAVGKTSSSVQW
jgi:hypothetical protein